MRVHGVSVDEVAQQLGHKNLGAPRIYTEYGQQYLKSAREALDQVTCPIRAGVEMLEACKLLKNLVLPVRIERTTSPLPRECSTTELRQQKSRDPYGFSPF